MMSSPAPHALPQQELADYTLIELACSGDQLAFEALIQRYHYRLYRFVKNHIASDEAADVVQFVWLQLHLSLSTLQQNQALSQHQFSLKPWLFRVALNRCIDEKRKQVRRPPLFSLAELTAHDEEESSILLSMIDPAPEPEAQVELHEQQDSLWAAVQTLQAKPRLVVWLRYTQDLTFPEIARRLNLPTNTVKTDFYRACLKLRTTLQPVV